MNSPQTILLILIFNLLLFSCSKDEDVPAEVVSEKEDKSNQVESTPETPKVEEKEINFEEAISGHWKTEDGDATNDYYFNPEKNIVTIRITVSKYSGDVKHNYKIVEKVPKERTIVLEFNRIKPVQGKINSFRHRIKFSQDLKFIEHTALRTSGNESYNWVYMGEEKQPLPKNTKSVE